MKAVIMAGGKGTRLRPYTHVLPKPLLPIGERPIIEIILEKLKNQGISEAILTVNYRAEVIKSILGNGDRIGLPLTYFEEETELGTCGALKNLKGELTEKFLVVNGDTLIDLNLEKLTEFHLKNESDLTVVSTKIKIPISYGVLESNVERVVGWREKPSLNAEVSVGTYMVNPSVIDFIPSQGRYDMPELAKKIIESGGRVNKFPYEGKWLDLSKVGDLESAQKEMLEIFGGD